MSTLNNMLQNYKIKSLIKVSKHKKKYIKLSNIKIIKIDKLRLVTPKRLINDRFCLQIIKLSK